MTNSQLNDLFQRIAEELDISDTLFERAETSYKALGEYINNNCDFSVSIYTQGSFRLGTVIRPLNDEDEYDLDLISEIQGASFISAKDLKILIGDILRGSKRYSSKLEEKKRCWRIEYSDEAQFHMDITPAITDRTVTTSISITNKLNDEKYSFTVSNPKGYSDWFETRKKVREILKDALYQSASVEPIKIKENKIKLPLQRAVQILKRHRDIVFEQSPDIKPISIVITTLAAQAYKGESKVYDALKQILETMSSFINTDNGHYNIPNPSNPKENFADKWNSEPAKARAFFAWLNKAKTDIITIAPGIIDDYSVLEESLGETVVSRALSDTAPIVHNSKLLDIIYSSPVIKNMLNVSYRQKPPFKLPKQPFLGIKATVTENGFTSPYQNNGHPIPKYCSIDFELIAPQNLLKNGYAVIWQIVNTGDDARINNGLRGGFETEVNTTRRNEGTQYHGTHYLQAFLLKHGKCVGMTHEFIVNIK